MAVYGNTKIATAWDNEAGYAVVEAIAVSGTTLQLEDVVRGFAFAANTHFFVKHQSPQQNRVTTADGGSVQNGYETVIWTIPICSGIALEHWIDTYVGKVTIATLRYGVVTHENWNAMGGFPDFRDSDKQYRGAHWWYRNVNIAMKLVATT